jgi:hypothetical protein
MSVTVSRSYSTSLESARFIDLNKLELIVICMANLNQNVALRFDGDPIVLMGFSWLLMRSMIQLLLLFKL